MAVLKKIKASTLMETLVASVLIVVIFMMSSMILNNLFSNSVKNNTRAIDAHLNELQYLYINEKLSLPYQDGLGSWNITVEPHKSGNEKKAVMEAINTETKKHITKEIIED